jgi:hypothetical protein
MSSEYELVVAQKDVESGAKKPASTENPGQDINWEGVNFTVGTGAKTK